MSSARLWVNTASIAQFSHFVYQLAVSIKVPWFKQLHNSRASTNWRVSKKLDDVWNSEFDAETRNTESARLQPGGMYCFFLKSFALAEFKKIRIHKKILGVSHHIC